MGHRPSILDEDEEAYTIGRIKAAKAQREYSSFKNAWRDVKGMIQGKPKVYTGERTTYFNNASLNAANKYPGNSVSTNKYNVITFLPIFLFGQFCFVLY